MRNILIDDTNENFDMELENALLQSLEEGGKTHKKSNDAPPPLLNIFPLTRRPFFPGMAAPIVIEPGPYYEILKQIAKTEDKYVGVVLTKTENADTSNLHFKDLHPIGVLARVLRIIPIEQGGAQVILNMEMRMRIVKPEHEGKTLSATVEYLEDNHKLTDELKAYAISIISTIKELLKLNPLFKEELQIFLGAFRLYRTGQTCRLCRRPDDCFARRTARCSGDI